MNIIDALSQQLHISENAAKGLAGQVLGLIEDTVREKVSFGVASKIRDAVPEMLQWQSSSPTILPGSLSLSETPLPRAENDEAELVRLLERFQVPVKDAVLVGSLALQFLSSRVDAPVLAVIARTMPVLTRSP